MITAHFDHGPLDGQTREIPGDSLNEPPLAYVVDGVRYVLTFIDTRKAVAHYYIPTSERR